MFFLIEITTTDKTAKAVYQYDSQAEAIANFHSKIGGQMKNADCMAELVIVIDDNGAVIKAEKFAR